MGMELDILRGCEIAPVDETIDLDNVQKFIKLEPTQGQKMQISALMNQLPALIGVSTLSKTMMLRFPEGVQGTLMQLKSNGGYTTTLKSLETGKITGTCLVGVRNSASNLSRCIYCDVCYLWTIFSLAN